MRPIYTQSAQGSSALRITADQPPFRGMASHRYIVEGFDTTNNRAVRSSGFVPRFRELSIIFETEGASNDFNPDGISMDALLAILADHLSGQLAGPNGTMGKQLALEYIESARDVLAQESHVTAFEQPSHTTHYAGTFARTGTGSL